MKSETDSGQKLTDNTNNRGMRPECEQNEEQQ